ncbi:thioredoxin [Sorangium cellulosum]|uniref:Thioredoxin n=1 Tax=Sorangium cellulosum TaxID=56 RepID=A0A150QB50_SORCE|nr:thioredoxin [Sorangium cellulosum]KYF65201.1 thiol-disulfide isomerase [Sorangium cellulosum]
MGSRNVIEVNDLNFAREVLETDTPVLVDFSASWCAPCKRLAPIVDEIAEETAGQVKVVKLDVDESPAAAKRFDIRGLPTVVAFQNGEPVKRHTGLTNKKTLLALLGR